MRAVAKQTFHMSLRTTESVSRRCTCVEANMAIKASTFVT